MNNASQARVSFNLPKNQMSICGADRGIQPDVAQSSYSNHRSRHKRNHRPLASAGRMKSTDQDDCDDAWVTALMLG